MTDHMSTAHGLSEETNSHTKDQAFHGNGQGMASVPPNWSFTSNTCLDEYSDKAHGCIIKDPTKTLKQERDADMSVDSLTAQHNSGRYDYDEVTLVTMTNHDINLWDQLLYIAGGLLESLKTGYALIIWQFSKNGMPSLKKEEDLVPSTVSVKQDG
eukprot:1934206-Ditylum_brightwellii.AAC.1